MVAMIKNIKRILKSKKGESLAESLIALTIAAIAMLILAGGIVTAAKVNIQARNSYTFMDTKKGSHSSTENWNGIQIGKGSSFYDISDLGDGTETTTVSVTLYKDEYIVNGETKYYYYWIPEIEDVTVVTP